MKTKQKFFYMVLGGVLSVAVLLIGMAISPLTAERNGSFGEITCTSLEVVNSAGTPVVRLSRSGSVEICFADGNMAILLYAADVSFDHPPGGFVGVYGKSGRAIMSINEHGGRVSVSGKTGDTRAAMGINKYGNGAVSTWDKNGYLQ